jgi:magnesium transporter
MNTTTSSNKVFSIFGISSDSAIKNVIAGCILAILGNIMISVALNVQKYVHVIGNEDISHKHYSRRPLWWFGLFLMIFGEVGNFTAYGFAPASMVAPLGTVAVVSNVFIAITFLKEKLRNVDILGTCSALVGAILIISFSRKGEGILNGDQLTRQLLTLPFLLYGTVEGLLLLTLLIAHHGFHNNSVVVLLLISAVIASFTIISAKGVSGMIQLTLNGMMQWKYPILYIMIVVLVVTGVVQVIYINRAMKNHDSTLVVPTNFVFFTISAILSGIIYYNEFDGLTMTQVLLFLLGCMFSFIGVFLIQYDRPSVLTPPALETNERRDSEDAASFASTVGEERGLVATGPDSVKDYNTVQEK